MRTVTIKVPDQIKLPDDEVESRIRIELAIRLYQKGIASFGQARKIAGIPKHEFLKILIDEKVPLRYDSKDLKDDLEIIKKLEKRL